VEAEGSTCDFDPLMKHSSMCANKRRHYASWRGFVMNAASERIADHYR